MARKTRVTNVGTEKDPIWKVEIDGGTLLTEAWREAAPEDLAGNDLPQGGFGGPDESDGIDPNDFEAAAEDEVEMLYEDLTDQDDEEGYDEARLKRQQQAMKDPKYQELLQIIHESEQTPAAQHQDFEILKEAAFRGLTTPQKLRDMVKFLAGQTLSTELEDQ